MGASHGHKAAFFSLFLGLEKNNKKKKRVAEGDGAVISEVNAPLEQIAWTMMRTMMMRS